MEHRDFLLEALALAQLNKGSCAPNPSVGALLVKQGKIIATGIHKGPGAAHAEVMACKDASTDLIDTTLYITLEPCCHWGRTPPCTDLILKHNIKEVIFGYLDPNPLVSGQGQNILRQQGVNCQHIPIDEINDFYNSYTHWTHTKQPYITCKMAMSLDGKIAYKDGKPAALTNEECKRYTHQCRKRSDAILTSITTIINDDPLLNVRLDNETLPKPLYVLDTHLALPLNAKILKTGAKITLFHAQASESKRDLLIQQGVDCRLISINEGKLNLPNVVSQIGLDGVHDLYIEAGGVLTSAFLREQLVNRCLVYIAPTLLGHSALPGFVGEKNLLTQAKNIKWSIFDQDVVCDIIF